MSLPQSSWQQIRMVSYNITAYFFDRNDKTSDHRHNWSVRKPFVERNSFQPIIISCK